MIRNCLLAIGAAALAGCANVAPHPDAPALGFDDARQLLVRTGFGATPQAVEAYAALSRREAAERLLGEATTASVTPPPEFVRDTPPFARLPKDAPAAERAAFRERRQREMRELRAWWMQEMIATPSPLTERMTLFWHGHFATSVQKVRSPALMYEQNVMLRANALGHFDALLRAVAKDPAMIVYLDGAQNRKGAPNENFAREVMELFSLGEGRYDEQDVREAARAFTGWGLDRDTGRFKFRARLHDDGAKTLFGRRGNLDGADVIEMLLARPETADFIVSKLWREFVSPTPDPREVKRIAAGFRGAGYDIKVALRGLLTSDAFYAAGNRGTLTKSPVDVVAGTLRTLAIAPASAAPYAAAAAAMGQALFAPPNVKGWPGGVAWINTGSLLARKQFLERVAHASAPEMAPAAAGPRRFDASEWLAAPSSAAPLDALQRAEHVLLPLAPYTADVARAERERDPALVVRAALLDPVFQLK